MSTTALVMAGGQGLRMRASGVCLPKPLVPVLAVPLLERNIHALIRYGLTNIAIALPRGIAELDAFVAARLQPLTAAAGGSLEVFVEDQPLGNIGCAGNWRDRVASLLVVYSDNLTTLDLSPLLAEHENSGADLTLATHQQPFRMPFGEVRIEAGDVRAYFEKPVYNYTVCSAVSVLGRRALTALPDDRPTGLSGLAQSLIDSGGHVRAFPHSAPWIDVNDAVALGDAEELVTKYHHDFELWARPPATHAALLLAVKDDAVLLTPPSRSQNGWSLPWLHAPSTQMLDVSALRRLFSADAAPPGEPWLSLDDLDDAQLRTCRFHVYRTAAPAEVAVGGAWHKLADVAFDPRGDRVAKRVAAMVMSRRQNSSECHGGDLRKV